MIVKILSNGKSFSGLATYLSHDAEQAKSAERVDWTRTLNCANDDVSCAVNEMVWTARDAELLKQEAGIRAGGRATENTVKHFSLSWSPEEKPTAEHMMETTQDFLRHMKWEEHQAILFSHTDKPHAHVHCMLNTVHPETGLRLNDSYEQVRASGMGIAVRARARDLLRATARRSGHARAQSAAQYLDAVLGKSKRIRKSRKIPRRKSGNFARGREKSKK